MDRPTEAVGVPQTNSPPPQSQEKPLTVSPHITCHLGANTKTPHPPNQNVRNVVQIILSLPNCFFFQGAEVVHGGPHICYSCLPGKQWVSVAQGEALQRVWVALMD